MEENSEGLGVFCNNCDSEFIEGEYQHESRGGDVCESCADQYQECGNCYLLAYPEDGDIVDGEFICKDCNLG